MSTRVPRWDAIWRLARGLRNRLLWQVLPSFGIGFGLTWYYSAAVFRLLLAPAGGILSPFGGLPIYTAPAEMFSATISLAIKGGLVTALPVTTYSVLREMAPWLPRNQRRFIAFFVPVTIVCFLGGAAFAYFVMLPVGLTFLLHFGEGVAVATIRISEYMSLISAMVLWIGLVFELPPVMFLLARLKLVSHKKFKRFRKHVPIAALIFSGIITPTLDGVNMVMVAVPIWVLYEVGLGGAWVAEGGGRTLARRATATAVWVAKRLAIALVVALLAVVAWQLVVSGMDGRLNIEDWHRAVEDWGRFWEAVRRGIP